MVIEGLLDLAIDFCRRLHTAVRLDGLTSQIDRHAGLWPTHVRDPSRRHEDTVAAPPIARVHHEVANRPGVIVNQQVLQMADDTICRPDVMTDDDVAAQVAVIRRRQVPVVLKVLLYPCLHGQAARICAHAPQARASPVVRIPVAPEY